MNAINTRVQFPHHEVTGDFEVYSDKDGKTYIVPEVTRFAKEGKGMLIEHRVYFLASETEPDPQGREGHRFHRGGLDTRDSIRVETEAI